MSQLFSLGGYASFKTQHDGIGADLQFVVRGYRHRSLLLAWLIFQPQHVCRQVVRFVFVHSQSGSEVDAGILSSEPLAGSWSAHFVLHLCVVRVLEFDVCRDLDIAAFLPKIR